MCPKNTDDVWEYYGKNDPYYGVLTLDRNAAGKLTESVKHEIFASGDRYVEWLVETIRQHLDPAFGPRRGLDFGCGVGRLALPLARVCRAVVGVDVSESMLAVAQDNARERNADNITFVKSDDALSQVVGLFDFVHSFIVFQHIPPDRGMKIFARLIDLLEPDGTGALHLTYAHARTARTWRRLIRKARQSIPLFSGIVNLLRGRRFGEPSMQMNEYDVNELLRILQESGCHQVMLRFTETSVQGHGFYGVSFLFRKTRVDVRAHA